MAGWVDEPDEAHTISADIDEESGYALHFALARLLALPSPGVDRDSVRVWRTRHGWHLFGYLTRPVRHDVADALRGYIGDDEKRVEYDQRDRNRPQQVLFDVRRGVRKRVEITEEVMHDIRPREELGIPHARDAPGDVRMVQAPAEVAKRRIAKEGT